MGQLLATRKACTNFLKVKTLPRLGGIPFEVVHETITYMIYFSKLDFYIQALRVSN